MPDKKLLGKTVKGNSRSTPFVLFCLSETLRFPPLPDLVQAGLPDLVQAGIPVGRVVSKYPEDSGFELHPPCRSGQVAARVSQKLLGLRNFATMAKEASGGTATEREKDRGRTKKSPVGF